MNTDGEISKSCGRLGLSENDFFLSSLFHKTCLFRYLMVKLLYMDKDKSFLNYISET